MDIKQLRDFIIIPALQNTLFYSEASVNLVLLTAGCESNFGEYVRQINGPAMGIYQIEPPTYNDVMKYLDRRSGLLSIILKQCFYHEDPPIDSLMYDLRYSTLLARAYYYRFEESLPDKDDWEGLATYWKKYYNTELGRGSVEGAIHISERIKRALE